MIKKTRYDLRKYYKEYLTAFFAFISLMFTFFYKDQPLYLWGSILVVLISLMVFVFFRSLEKDFYFIELKNRKEKDDWIGWGDFDFDRNERCFFITNSAEGHIFSKCLNWSNYKVEFEFKILNSCIGVIIRAGSLFNYTMLQIATEGVNPHICIMGGWKRWEHKDVFLTFANELSLDQWYRCILVCDKENIKIRIYSSGTKLFDREWHIPRGIMSVFYENAPGETTNQKTMNYPINLEYGSFGFRNCNKEKALIRNIIINKL